MRAPARCEPLIKVIEEQNGAALRLNNGVSSLALEQSGDGCITLLESARQGISVIAT